MLCARWFRLLPPSVFFYHAWLDMLLLILTGFCSCFYGVRKVLVLEEIWDGFQANIYHSSVSNLINIEIILTRKCLTERSL